MPAMRTMAAACSNHLAPKKVFVVASRSACILPCIDAVTCPAAVHDAVSACLMDVLPNHAWVDTSIHTHMCTHTWECGCSTPTTRCHSRGHSRNEHPDAGSSGQQDAFGEQPQQHCSQPCDADDQKHQPLQQCGCKALLVGDFGAHAVWGGGRGRRQGEKWGRGDGGMRESMVCLAAQGWEQQDHKAVIEAIRQRAQQQVHVHTGWRCLTWFACSTSHWSSSCWCCRWCGVGCAEQSMHTDVRAGCCCACACAALWQPPHQVLVVLAAHVPSTEANSQAAAAGWHAVRHHWNL